MEHLFTSGFKELAVGVAVMAGLVAVAAYAIKKTRPKSAQQELTTGEMLTKFRELHAQGELSDTEFRTIKTTLAAKLHAELNGNDETV